MKSSDAWVSVGLPVRNGAKSIDNVIRSVLAQDHERLELVICDNASTDATEDICREYAANDSRVAYIRHSTNIGLLSNFVSAIQYASGEYFRWIGDDDWLDPSYVSKALAVFDRDDRLVLVTTQVRYSRPDGSNVVEEGHIPEGLASADPGARFAQMLRLLNSSPFLVDPLYSLARRRVVAAIPRRNMLREDQVFATKLALAGPWGHVPETLAVRNTRLETRASVARLLDAPAWHAHAANTVQCLEMLRWLSRDDLAGLQRRRARSAVARMYVDRQVAVWKHRASRGRQAVDGLLAREGHSGLVWGGD